MATDHLLFQHDGDVIPPSSTQFHQQRQVDFNGRVWLLEFDHLNPLGALQYSRVGNVLLTGLLLGGMLFAMLYAMATTQVRAERIADKLTEAIRQRELELNTPAGAYANDQPAGTRSGL